MNYASENILMAHAGEELRRLRLGRGQSIRAFAAAIGAATATVQRCENAENLDSWHITTLARVAAFFGLSVPALRWELGGRAGEKPEDPPGWTAGGSADKPSGRAELRYEPDDGEGVAWMPLFAAIPASPARTLPEGDAGRVGRVPASWAEGLGVEAGSCYAIRVAGKSMEPVVPDGAVVVVDRLASARANGELVLGDRGGLGRRRARGSGGSGIGIARRSAFVRSNSAFSSTFW